MGFYNKHKYNKLIESDVEINYKDLDLCRQFLTETAKIVPSRVTGTTPKQQRQLVSAIKYARYLALIEYCDKH